jgi:hypothetical protein
MRPAPSDARISLTKRSKQRYHERGASQEKGLVHTSGFCPKAQKMGGALMEAQVAETAKPGQGAKPLTRIQARNRETILEAALDVFSAHGFRGATVDQIASSAGLSKPNLLYYFASKESMHVALLAGLMDTWLEQ